MKHPRMRITVKLLFATIVAGFGSGFQHGYNSGVTNPPQKVIEAWIGSVYSERSGEIKSDNFVTTIFSLAVSIYCVGGIFGGLCTRLFASVLGRKKGLIINNIFAIIAAILMGSAKAAKAPEMLIIGRFFTGYNSGLNSGLAAMYLVEISPKEMRGAIGTVYQLIITISILFSQVLGLKECLGTENYWPILFGLIGIVAIGQLLLLPFCPESPKFLFVKKGEEKCGKALHWLRGDEIEEDMNEIKTEIEKEKELGQANCHQFLSNKLLRTPLIISLMVMLAQQLSGINAVIFYSTKIFEEAEFSYEDAQKATLCIAVMNIVMTLVSLFLVDRCGRKTLLLIGFGLMFMNTLFLTISLNFLDHGKFFQIASGILVVLFVVSFAVGPGSIPWFLVGEMFTQDARPLATSVAVAVNWSANFVVGFSFLLLQELMKANVFLIFAFLQLLFFVFIIFKVPETKNKTYDEIITHFQ